jgi:hypothetical protein
VKMRKWEWKERENVESVFFSLFLWVSLSLETVITTSRKSRENPASFWTLQFNFVQRRRLEACLISVLCNDVMWLIEVILGN